MESKPAILDAQGNELPAAPPRQPPPFPWALCSLGYSLAAIILAVYTTVASHPKDVTGQFTVPSSSWVTTTTGERIDTSLAPVPITSGYLSDSLADALAAWDKALGVKLLRPELVKGYCSPDAIACVPGDSSRYRITYQGSSGSTDIKTVFMHEIGHLLGVPHIEGDPLMDAVNHAALKKPSADAVLIARSREGIAWSSFGLPHTRPAAAKQRHR